MIIKRVIDECYKRHTLFESCEDCPYRGKQCKRVTSIVIANTKQLSNVNRDEIRPSDYITL